MTALGGRRGRLAIPVPQPTPGQGRVGRVENETKVQLGVRPLFQELDAPYSRLQRSQAQSSEVLTRLLRDQEQVIHDMLGPALELRAKVLALRRDARGARVEVALPCHIAAQRDQHAGAKAELLSAEKGGDDDVAAAAQAPVSA